MRWPILAAVAALLLAATSAEATGIEFAVYHPAPERTLTYAIARSPRVYRLAAYIRRKRGVDAETAFAFAESLCATRWPYTLAAIGAAEGRFNPREPRGPAGEEGAFRIIPRIWGPVPGTIHGQVQQAAGVLETLIARHGYRKAVRCYNGSGEAAERYAGWVLSQVRRI